MTRKLLLVMLVICCIGCRSTVNYLGLTERHIKKINRKYGKYTSVKIIESQNCQPEYEIFNKYPFQINKNASCDCAEFNKPYKYYRTTIEPSGREHYQDLNYMRFRVRENNVLGAIKGKFKGTKEHMQFCLNDKTLNEKGLYTIIETLEIDDCHFTAKYTFYFDPTDIIY